MESCYKIIYTFTYFIYSLKLLEWKAGNHIDLHVCYYRKWLSERCRSTNFLFFHNAITRYLSFSILNTNIMIYDTLTLIVIAEHHYFVLNLIALGSVIISGGYAYGVLVPIHIDKFPFEWPSQNFTRSDERERITRNTIRQLRTIHCYYVLWSLFRSALRHCSLYDKYCFF